MRIQYQRFSTNRPSFGPAMNHVSTFASKASNTYTLISNLQPCRHSPRIALATRSSLRTFQATARWSPIGSRLQQIRERKPVVSAQCLTIRHASSKSAASAHKKTTEKKPKPPRAPPAKTPPARPAQTKPAEVFAKAEIKDIFGTSVSVAWGTKVLHELQERRTSGSLADRGIAFPDVTEEQGLKALAWLRQKYPVDEEAAAAQWAEEEVARLEQEYMERAEKLGLYKKSEPEESVGVVQPVDEIYGPSVLVERRRLVEEEERLALEKQAENGPTVQDQQLDIIAQKRVELASERKREHWERLKEAAQIEPEKIFAERSAFSRLWAPTLVGLGVAGLSLVYAESYEPPSLSMRLFPDVPPAMSTCIALAAANAAVFVLWRLPRAWWMMNRYFMLSAGHPNAFSVLGALFSHQYAGHLLQNMAFIGLVGLQVHEEIGRGNFLALYLTAGIAGSLTSLWYRVLTRDFLAATVGASGAVYGIVCAFLTVRDDREMHLPWPVNRSFEYDSRILLALVVAYEFFIMRRAKGKGPNDHLTHLGGMTMGALGGLVCKWRSQRDAASVQMTGMHAAEEGLDADNSMDTRTE
ncbi:hypothetical protein EJ06DRAFT_388012 [Trichodelitschia bisporula]|uniref:Peptidase S54 rhomboid domain-containing protein n=1 Tax=Trichodelitschia bisporula TaxID=703511 RepID=A0A6G1HZT0_9PEZI|nr:hypothetical protein EJ06DRAFT_388012 [Trichodelitschia bisporula]